MKTVRYSPEATRDLLRHRTMAARIKKALAEYAAGDGAHANQVRKLVGSSERRLRVGDYRAIFEEVGDELIVTAVRPRGSVYDR